MNDNRVLSTFEYNIILHHSDMHTINLKHQPNQWNSDKHSMFYDHVENIIKAQDRLNGIEDFDCDSFFEGAAPYQIMKKIMEERWENCLDVCVIQSTVINESPVFLYGKSGMPKLEYPQSIRAKDKETNGIDITKAKYRTIDDVNKYFEQELPLWFLDLLFNYFFRQDYYFSKFEVINCKKYSDYKYSAINNQYCSWSLNRKFHYKHCVFYPHNFDLLSISLVCKLWHNLVHPVYATNNILKQPFERFSKNFTRYNLENMTPIMRGPRDMDYSLGRFEHHPPPIMTISKKERGFIFNNNYKYAKWYKYLRNNPLEPFPTDTLGFDHLPFQSSVLNWLFNMACYESGFTLPEKYISNAIGFNEEDLTEVDRLYYAAQFASHQDWRMEVTYFGNLQIKPLNKFNVYAASPAFMTLISCTRVCKLWHSLIMEDYFVRCDACGFAWLASFDADGWAIWKSLDIAMRIPFCRNCRYSADWLHIYETAVPTGFMDDSEFPKRKEPIVEITECDFNPFDQEKHPHFWQYVAKPDPTKSLKRKAQNEEALGRRVKAKLY